MTSLSQQPDDVKTRAQLPSYVLMFLFFNELLLNGTRVLTLRLPTAGVVIASRK